MRISRTFALRTTGRVGITGPGMAIARPAFVTPEPSARMIVCSCNVLSEARIRAVLDHPQPPQRVLEVHHRLGCRPQCGCCVRAILDIMRDSQGAAPCHGVCAADEAAA